MVDKNFYNAKTDITLAQAAEVMSATLQNPDCGAEKIADIATMKSATPSDICFFYDRKEKNAASEIKAKACVTTADLQEFVAAGVAIIISDNPKLAFIKLNELMYAEKRPTAQIKASKKISPSAKIGKNCYIYAGARIGQDGFGFQLINGQHHRIPQLGRVIIGDDVEIGANACIDRGALDDTVIGSGSRLDNLTQIAHNDKLGHGCVIVAQVGIAGSCVLGDYVVCGGQVGIADHLNIGSGVQIAAQSGVMRDIEAGQVMMGSPCVPFKDFMRQVAFLQKNSTKK